MHNLLTDSIFTVYPSGERLSLPGVFAALVRDEVESFAALRPHQDPAWHQFLVQVAAGALHRGGLTEPPGDEEAWRALLRGLTPGYPDDEPWRLTVADPAKPAFLQPAFPPGVELKTEAETPDAIDLLITAKNHDLKQAVARHASPEDWVYALISLQTGDGYNGAGNYGISRMNGGSSSRPLLGLAPVESGRLLSPRPGPWFRRDVAALLASREKILDELPFADPDGHLLLWTVPWPEGEQLRLDQLDPWYVEVCRRVRLYSAPDGIAARKGTSKAARIDAKALNGVVGDPWAPVNTKDVKSFTLSGGDFDYTTLCKLLFSAEWRLPALALPAPFERRTENFLLVAAALARGNSKTEGFKRREIRVTGRAAHEMADEKGRNTLGALARQQMDEISWFGNALRGALAVVAAGGDWNDIRKEHRLHARTAARQLDREADARFFDHLWRRFGNQEEEALAAIRLDFAQELWTVTRRLFEAALPAIPCPARDRLRAEARGWRRLLGDKVLRTQFPELFPKTPKEEAADAVS
jgi:CRISPR system Cascade subunit CasA